MAVPSRGHGWTRPISRRIQLITITAIVIVLFAAVARWTSHRGGLAYFSPYTLEYRTQSERTFFGTGVPLFRPRHDRGE